MENGIETAAVKLRGRSSADSVQSVNSSHAVCQDVTKRANPTQTGSDRGGSRLN